MLEYQNGCARYVHNADLHAPVYPSPNQMNFYPFAINYISNL